MVNKNMKSKNKKKEDHSGLFIPAGLFIGLGLGFVFNQIVAGVLLGLGVGFLLMALVKAAKR